MQPKKKREKKKRFAIQIRATEELHKEMKMSAREAGMTMTGFILSCTLGKAPRTKIATPFREAFIRLLAETGKINSNVDQIGKIMSSENGAGYSSMLKEIGNDVYYVVQKASNELLRQLDNGLSKWKGKAAIPYLGIFIRLLDELRVAGLDVNQIAKAMNTEKDTGYSATVKESVITQTFEAIRKASNELLNHLEHGIGKGPSAGERQPACDLSTNQSG